MHARCRNLNSTQLQDLIDHYTYNLRASIDSYTVTLPMTFPDFGVVANCTPAATTAFLATLGASLGLSSANMTCSCVLGAATTTVSGRRLTSTSVSCRPSQFGDTAELGERGVLQWA